MATQTTNTSTLKLNSIDETACGPTDYSHWVIPRRLLASAYPSSKNHQEQRSMTEKLIIDHSINVIVNLMTKKELTHFVPYADLMTEYANKVNRSLEFISFPIRDQHIDENHERVLEFSLDLCQRLERGEILLIHCWGGHGRTGTIVSIIIGILFNMKSSEAMKINRELHRQRRKKNKIPSPQSTTQFEQVRFVLDELYPRFQLLHT